MNKWALRSCKTLIILEKGAKPIALGRAVMVKKTFYRRIDRIIILIFDENLLKVIVSTHALTEQQVCRDIIEKYEITCRGLRNA